MAWTGSTGGVGPWTKTGTAREVVLANEPAPQNNALVYQVGAPEFNVFALLRSSPDGNSGIEVLVNATDVVIRRVEYGVVAQTYSTTAHTLASNQAYTLDVRPLNNTVEVRLNGDTTAIVTEDLGTTFEFQTTVGFGSSTAGARVLAFSVCSLTAQTADRADVLVMVRGGNLFTATDQTAMTRRASGVMDLFADVSMAELEQKLYMVDGSNARIFDPATLTVTPYTPTAGAGLIGATDDGGGGFVAGTTTATGIVRHISRLWFFGMKGDPQNIVATAVDDPLDLDTGSDLPGRAFALNAERGKIGQPIVSAQSSSATTLIVGCEGSIWAIRGDPTLGAVDVSPMTLDVGTSGREAMTLASEGLVIAHTPSGLYMIPEGGTPVPVSMGTLTELIQVDNATTDYRVQVLRDTVRHGTQVFLTLRETGESVHLWYDERIGGYTRPGGFFPEQYPDNIGPTCSTIWRGMVVMGGRDGKLYVFDDSAKDDAGTAIDSYATGSLLHDGDTFKGIKHGRAHLLMSDTSDQCRVSMYGGVTADESMDPVAGDLLWSRVVSGRSTIIDRTGMASFLAVRWEGTETVGTRWLIEGMQIETTLTDIRRGSRSAPVVPPGPCPAPSPAVPTPDPDFDTGDGNDDDEPEPEFWPELYIGVSFSTANGTVNDQPPQVGPFPGEPGGGNQPPNVSFESAGGVNGGVVIASM